MTARLTDPVPVISPQQAAADRRAFMAKKSLKATAQEMRDELAVRAKELREKEGLSWAAIGERIGYGKDEAHALADPAWAKENRRKARERQRRKKQATA